MKRITALLAFLPSKIDYSAKQWVPVTAVIEYFIGWCSERPQVSRCFEFVLNKDNYIDVKRLFRLLLFLQYGLMPCTTVEKLTSLLFVRAILIDLF